MKLSHSIVLLAATANFMTSVDGFSMGVPSSSSSSSSSSNRLTQSKRFETSTTTRTSTELFYGSEENVSRNLSFESPVLQKLYPALLKHKEEYGNPNIPLGSSEGRQCQTLRRLHIQKKLTEQEEAWLESIGFTFHSLEDVYRYADFDDLFDRLMKYEEAHPESNFQVPKKCPEDPELGAWVTGIRRLGKDGVNPEHERRLDSVGFAWKSTRKCGSKFMKQYREFVKIADSVGIETVLDEPATINWVRAQQEALKRGNLSQTRVYYMEQLFGDSWTTMGRDVE